MARRNEPEKSKEGFFTLRRKILGAGALAIAALGGKGIVDTLNRNEAADVAAAERAKKNSDAAATHESEDRRNKADSEELRKIKAEQAKQDVINPEKFAQQDFDRAKNLLLDNLTNENVKKTGALAEAMDLLFKIDEAVKGNTFGYAKMLDGQPQDKKVTDEEREELRLRYQNKLLSLSEQFTKERQHHTKDGATFYVSDDGTQGVAFQKVIGVRSVKEGKETKEVKEEKFRARWGYDKGYIKTGIDYQNLAKSVQEQVIKRDGPVQFFDETKDKEEPIPAKGKPAEAPKAENAKPTALGGRRAFLEKLLSPQGSRNKGSGLGV